jgi:hypothetical protein
MTFAPYQPLALRPQARPPLPPPMTKKSHSLVTGAIFAGKFEKCRETEESLEVAVLKAMLVAGRVRRVKAFMRNERNERKMCLYVSEVKSTWMISDVLGICA